LPRLIGDTVPLPAIDAAPVPAKKAKIVTGKNATPKVAAVPQSAPEKPAPVKVPKIVPVEEIDEEIFDELPGDEPALAIAPDEEPAEDARAGRRIEAKQEEMQFDGPTRGRFEKTHETIYRGENLDQPTFRRRRLTVQL